MAFLALGAQVCVTPGEAGEAVFFFFVSALGCQLLPALLALMRLFSGGPGLR